MKATAQFQWQQLLKWITTVLYQVFTDDFKSCNRFPWSSMACNIKNVMKYRYPLKFSFPTVTYHAVVFIQCSYDQKICNSSVDLAPSIRYKIVCFEEIEAKLITFLCGHLGALYAFPYYISNFISIIGETVMRLLHQQIENQNAIFSDCFTNMSVLQRDLILNGLLIYLKRVEIGFCTKPEQRQLTAKPIPRKKEQKFKRFTTH